MGEPEKKKRGDILRASDWNDLVDAVHDAERRAGEFKTMLPGANAAPRPPVARYKRAGDGFSIVCVTRQGSEWKAYFHPGRIINQYGDETATIEANIGGMAMSATPTPSISATIGANVYLNIIGNANTGQVYSAELSTAGAQPAGCMARLIMGTFAAGTGSMSDVPHYVPYITGAVPYVRASAGQTVEPGEGLEWKIQPTGTTAGVIRGRIDPSTSQEEGAANVTMRVSAAGFRSLLEYSGDWTALAPDTDYAIKLGTDALGRLRIILGKWDTEAGDYAPYTTGSSGGGTPPTMPTALR